jgi:endonuclease/exonuclease/phosphatase family metal-dependent hydrolase
MAAVLHGGVVVDGDPAEWATLPRVSVAEDSAGDAPQSGPDFRSLQAWNDGYNLYLLVEFAAPVDLRSANLRLYIDADNDPATGIPLDDRGMDFSWDFDRNRGTSTLTSRGDIGRGNLVERMAPDQAATVHEIAISLEALPAAAAGEPVHVVLLEETSRDRIPDVDTQLAVTCAPPLSVQPLPIRMTRTIGSIRILSWNVYFDAAFSNSNNRAAFRRVLMALQPDILLLQELYSTPTETIRLFLQDTLQSKPGSEWQIARNQDCVTVSRFPIAGEWPTRGNLLTRLDTTAELGQMLLVANNHFPCCNSESGRISESLDLLELIDTRLADPGSAPQSLIIGGDLNSGGLAPELVMLTNGAIPLEMASPRHVYSYDQYTWGSRGSIYGSSRLDFILFDPASLYRQKAFIVDTDLLPPEALSEFNLQAADTFVSDHLPLVLDLRSRQLPALLQADPIAPDGSTESAWFGRFSADRWPEIEHEDLGWLRMYESNGGYWAATSWGGWLWTGPEAYPWIWAARFE